MTDATFDAGDGTPFVFVHGWLGSSESWKRVKEALDLDNPQLYYTQREHAYDPDCSYAFAPWADELAALIEQYGLANPVIVGHSMGGMIAQTYAVRETNYSGLVLLGTCASTPEPRLHSPQFFLDQLDAMDREQWAARIVDNYVGQAGDEQVRHMAKTELVNADNAALRNPLQAMIDYDLRDALDDVSVPACVVGGKHDGAITPEKITVLADILDCPVELLDASHLLLQEAPGQVADQIAQLVDRAAPQETGG